MSEDLAATPPLHTAGAASSRPPSNNETAPEVPLADTAALDAQAQALVAAIEAHAPHEREFKSAIDKVANLGKSDLLQAAAIPNALLNVSFRTVSTHALDADSPVSKLMARLEKKLDELDPSRQGDLFAKPRFFGVPVPFRNALQTYFRRYESSQAYINDLLEEFYRAKEDLLRDAISTEQEMDNLWHLTAALKGHAYVTTRVDALLAARIAVIRAADPARAGALESEALFVARRRRQNLETMTALTFNCYAALKISLGTNVRISQDIDEVTTETMTAFRSAVIVASVIAKQKLSFDRLQTPGKLTARFIAGNARALKETALAVSAQAAAPLVDIDTLKAAFADLFLAMDASNTARAAALPVMQQNIDAIRLEFAKAKRQLDSTFGERPALEPGSPVALADGPETA
jgi:uncharacterized protein YaaN involved in tellurite resistance